MAYIRQGAINLYSGLAVDPKPTDVPEGSELNELDTGKRFKTQAGANSGLATTSTLTEDLTAIETDVDVADGTLFAVAQTILVESEQMFITNVIANTLTVTRNVNGTSAATHANGAAVKMYRWYEVNPLFEGEGA